MLEPSTDRVRLDPVNFGVDPITYKPEGYRIVSLGDGSIEMHVGGAGAFGWILYFVLVELIATFGLGMRVPVIEVVAWVLVASLLLLALLIVPDDAVHVTRVWRFGPGRISRDMRLPLPARLWPREFVDVGDFEIAHTLWTQGLFSRQLHGGHQDTLKFTHGSREQITVVFRGLKESSATLRGAHFSQLQANEIAREILPDVLVIAALAAAKVGVPLYVIEKTFYVGSDSVG